MDRELGALAAGFPPVGLDTWNDIVGRTLSSATEDGLRVKALYTRADWPAGRSGSPGANPFTRGTMRSPGWDICGVIDNPEPEAARAAIAAELEGGATALALRLTGANAPWGMQAATPEDLDHLLADVPVAVPVTLDAGGQGVAAAQALTALWRRRGVSAADARAALDIDVIGAGADAPGALSVARRIDSEYPGVTSLAADLRFYHAAGASAGQEIAIALATGLAYLRLLDEAGLPLVRALPQIRFLFATDSDFFLSLAKLRAARLAWSRLLEACAIDPAAGPMRIWAESAWREMTRRDPHMNILRGTAACFAAALGGAESISVRPFDEALRSPSLFARRIARNTQLILAEEAGLSRVQDPAGGAWFVESATEQLAEIGWALFQEIERAGGIRAALSSGRIAGLIGATNKVRAARLATRSQPIVGVSLFPDPAEPAIQVMAPASAQIRHGLMAHRLAEPFEALRDAADAMPRRPRVFLANWGRPDDYRDAAAFARDLFAVGGIESIGEQGFTDKGALLGAARGSGAPLIVLCTSPEKRIREGRDLLAALRAAGARRLYAVAPANEADGADEALHDGIDVIGVLRRALDLPETAQP